MDYSENFSQQYKFEPQSCHFNMSLQCTLKHASYDTLPYECVYHLSDEMKYDFAFTSTIACHLLEVDIVCIGVSTPPQKHPPPLSCQAPP